MIEVSNVHLRYGDFLAVDGVNLFIEAGAFFSIVGPSGCGKTTLLRMLAGFLKPTGGMISIDGRDMTAVPPNLRPTNLVFQNYAIFPHLSVGENIAYGVDRTVSRGDRDEIVMKALRNIRMDGLKDRKPNQLSGGQRQRVALARALVRKPKVLLLDEPLGALDKNLRHEMQEELRDVQRSTGVTFVFVTHDQNEAFMMSDKMAVMSKGRLEQYGRPRELYERPSNLMVAGFLGDMNRLPGKVIQRDGERVKIVVEGVGELHALCFGQQAVGQSVQLCIRPECLRSAEATAGNNLVSGRVENRVYCGDHWRYRIRVSKEHSLSVVMPREMSETLNVDGLGEVRLQFAVKDAIVLGHE